MQMLTQCMHGLNLNLRVKVREACLGWQILNRFCSTLLSATAATIRNRAVLCIWQHLVMRHYNDS